MAEISRNDVVAAIGVTDEVIIRETVRTKASPSELGQALAFACNPSSRDIAPYRVLAPRVQRLVDLLSVALDRTARPTSTEAESSPHRDHRHAT